MPGPPGGGQERWPASTSAGSGTPTAPARRRREHLYDAGMPCWMSGAVRSGPAPPAGGRTCLAGRRGRDGESVDAHGGHRSCSGRGRGDAGGPGVEPALRPLHPGAGLLANTSTPTVPRMTPRPSGTPAGAPVSAAATCGSSTGCSTLSVEPSCPGTAPHRRRAVRGRLGAGSGWARRPRWPISPAALPSAATTPWWRWPRALPRLAGGPAGRLRDAPRAHLSANATVVSPGSLVPWLDQAWLERAVFDPASRVIDAACPAVTPATRKLFWPTRRRCRCETRSASIRSTTSRRSTPDRPRRARSAGGDTVAANDPDVCRQRTTPRPPLVGRRRSAEGTCRQAEQHRLAPATCRRPPSIRHGVFARRLQSPLGERIVADERR